MNKGFNNKGSRLFVPAVSSGTAAPETTPTRVGDLFLDTAADKLYQARGTASSADWVELTIT
jgi:hypothetical protein